MLRVYTIYTLKKLREPFVVEFALLVATVGFLSYCVSMSHVMANMPLTSPMGFSHFVIVAVTNTRLVVQLIILALTILIVSCARRVLSLKIFFGRRLQAHS